MKTAKLLLLIAAATLAVACTNKKEKMHCRIEGTVPDSTYTMMLLAPFGSDLRVDACDSIPVVDGKFSFDLYVDEITPYELISMEEYDEGAWFTCDFFAEEGTVNATFYHFEKENKGPTLKSESPTNKRYLQYNSVLRSMSLPLQQERDSLEKIGRWYSPRAMELEKIFYMAQDETTKDKVREEMNALIESGKAFTPEYHAFEEKSEKMRAMRDKYIDDFINNDSSLVGLFILQRQAIYNRDSSNESLFIALFNEVYQPLFPNHSLSKKMETWVQSRGIIVCGRYIDFTAPALDGTLHTLSKEIAGKIALIDLWASWCGSCRRTSMSMIPVYEAYKDKGFTIVGVARENNSEDMKLAIEKDGYPWLNLLELKDENKIWEKYGADNSGGRTILVNSNGTILAVSPTSAEVEQILQKLLGGK
ncbi:MAG: AhpC/TSA family protein [Bacteroidaceae bacterium]|nr:AhpC/TSA family protein [Bacteroidaceae bacterium]